MNLVPCVCMEDGEMAPWLRFFADLPEDLGSVLIPDMAAHSHLRLQFQKQWMEMYVSKKATPT